MLSWSEEDKKYMSRCLDLAMQAAGSTYPNPLVGSVIVARGSIIGEGYHKAAGTNHAEVNAIGNVTERSLIKEATLYVNMEPCSHYGKTPPCADFIIANGIREVVVGTIDTSSKVSGRGIDRLVKAGVKVTTGVLEAECRWINRRFFTYNEKRRPYIILKWAESADGYLDIDTSARDGRGSNWITGLEERTLVHRWRTQEQAILAGGNTIRVDNPQLNARLCQGRDPLRIILSKSGNVSADSALFKGEGKTLLFTENREVNIPRCEVVILDPCRNSGEQIMDYLFDAEIQSIIIEGGAATLNHFISLNLWDEARIFKGNKCFYKGIPAPTIEGKEFETAIFKESQLRCITREDKIG